METEQFWGKKGEMETELELIFIDFRSSNYLPWSVVIFFSEAFSTKKVSRRSLSIIWVLCQTAKPYAGNHGSEREGISEAGATCATRVLP